MNKYVTILFCLATCSVMAVDKTVNGVRFWYERLTDSRGILTANIKVGLYNDAHPEKIVVPSTIDGYSVTRVCAFGGIESREIVLPDSVAAIDVNTFKGCKYLRKINIPQGVTYIGDSAFEGCIELEAITIPTGIASIGEYFLYGCKKLKTLTIPESVKWLGIYSISGCSSLETIVFLGGDMHLSQSAISGCSSLRVLHMPGIVYESQTAGIPENFASGCSVLEELTLPTNIVTVKRGAFSGCYKLKRVIIPATVKETEESSFGGFSGEVEFLGAPPLGVEGSGLLNASRVLYPRSEGAKWRSMYKVAKIGGYVNPNKPVVTVVSSKVREDNPTVLDVVYKVASTKPTVKVRALAFEDGVRSFAKVTRPETFIEGTAVNLGDEIAPNVEHKLSWQVSSDFKTDLAKMKFEILAVEDDILPLEFISIPANGANKKMQLSWNLLTEAQVFDALLWLYADGDDGLLLEEGVLKRASDRYVLSEGVVLASDFEGQMTSSMYISGHLVTIVPGGRYYASAVAYVISKMGFSVLSGEELAYANEMTRLGLNPDGIRQYAWRWVEE